MENKFTVHKFTPFREQTTFLHCEDTRGKLNSTHAFSNEELIEIKSSDEFGINLWELENWHDVTFSRRG